MGTNENITYKIDADTSPFLKKIKVTNKLIKKSNSDEIKEASKTKNKLLLLDKKSKSNLEAIDKKATKTRELLEAKSALKLNNELEKLNRKSKISIGELNKKAAIQKELLEAKSTSKIAELNHKEKLLEGRQRKALRRKMLNAKKASLAKELELLKKAENDNIRTQLNAVEERKKLDISEQKGIIGRLDTRNKKLRVLQKKLLAAGLAMLFFGMALKRAGEAGMRTIIKTWSEAMDGTTEYNMTLGRLNAAFEFLKFAIADAFLSSEFGQMLVENLIAIFDWVSSLSPETLKWIGILLVVAIVFGAILMVVGQFTLAVLGVVALFGIFLIPAILIIVVIFLGVLALVLIWNSNMGLTRKIILSIIVVILVIIAILVIVGVVAISPWLVVGIIILALIALVVIFWDKIMLGALKFGKRFKEVLINPLVAFLNASLKIWDKIRGKTFVPIKMPTDTDFDKLISEREAKIAESEAKPGFNFDSLKEKAIGMKESVTNNISIDNLNVDAPHANDIPDSTSAGLEGLQDDLNRRGVGAGS